MVWVGANGGGINKWASKKQKFYKTHQYFSLPNSNSAFNNDVWSILETEKLVLLGTDGHGIAVYNSDDLFVKKTDNLKYWIKHSGEVEGNFKKNQVLALLEYGNGILIGTADGLYPITNLGKGSKYVKGVPKLKNKEISTIIKSETGEKIIVGTSKGEVFLLDQNLDNLEEIDYEFGRIFHLAKVTSNQILIGSQNGLYQIDLSTNKLTQIIWSKNERINLPNSTQIRSISVSYTHLTLPTICSV